MSSSSKLIDILGLSKFRNKMNEDINGKINTRAEASHTHVSDDITSLDASKLTGVIDIARLPAAALERLTIVDNTEARLALTINDVQNGDTVQEDDTGLLYRVIDDSKLGTEEAFRAYTSGASSTVPWSGVLNKPETFPPAEHTHKTVNGHTVESNVPADAVFTNTTYGMSSAMGGVKLESSNGDIDEVQVGIFYASCDTSCNTPDKVVTCGNFKLQTGAVIAVKFTAADTYSDGSGDITLNVDGTGAKSVISKEDGGVFDASEYSWFSGGKTALLVYNGVYFVYINIFEDYVYTPTKLGFAYVSCSTDEATLAKTVTVNSNFKRTTGCIIAVKFINAVPANSTLKIGNYTTLNILFRNERIADGVIEAGDTATMIYDGVQYRVIAINKDARNYETTEGITAILNSLDECLTNCIALQS